MTYFSPIGFGIFVIAAKLFIPLMAFRIIYRLVFLPMSRMEKSLK